MKYGKNRNIHDMGMVVFMGKYGKIHNSWEVYFARISPSIFDENDLAI